MGRSEVIRSFLFRALPSDCHMNVSRNGNPLLHKITLNHLKAFPVSRSRDSVRPDNGKFPIPLKESVHAQHS